MPKTQEKTTHARGRPADKLTPKQIDFVKNYTLPGSETYGNALRSFIMAGYSEKGAKENSCLTLQKPHIREYRDKLLSTITKDNIITQGRLDQELFEALEVAKEAGDLTNRLKTLQLIGQRIGAYTDKIDSNHTFKGYVPASPQLSIERQEQWLNAEARVLDTPEKVLDAPGCPRIDDLTPGGTITPPETECNDSED